MFVDAWWCRWVFRKITNGTVVGMSVNLPYHEFDDLEFPRCPCTLSCAIVLRVYLHFVGGSMAHESVYGHLGNSRLLNSWWGRFTLIPTTVPFVIFRKTHLRSEERRVG